MTIRFPSLTALRAFEAAARHESYKKAGNELNVTPTAISQQVSLLEEQLKIKLFVRFANRLKLTTPGRLLLPDLSAGFRQLSKAIDKIGDERPSGTVTVGVSSGMAVHLLIPNLSSFSKPFPNLNLSIHTSPNLELAAEDIDLKIRYCNGSSNQSYCQFLCDEYIFPICSPDLMPLGSHHYTIDDIMKLPLIHDIDGRYGQPWLGWERWLINYDFESHPGIEFRDSMSIMHAAINGVGVALGRSAILGDLINTGRLIAPLKEKKKADFSYYIETDNNRIEEPKVKAVIDWLISLV